MMICALIDYIECTANPLSNIKGPSALRPCRHCTITKDLLATVCPVAALRTTADIKRTVSEVRTLLSTVSEARGEELSKATGVVGTPNPLLDTASLAFDTVTQIPQDASLHVILGVARKVLMFCYFSLSTGTAPGHWQFAEIVTGRGSLELQRDIDESRRLTNEHCISGLLFVFFLYTFSFSSIYSSVE